MAAQTLAKQMDIGLFFSSMEELRQQLADAPRMDAIRANLWRQRQQFTFDAHVDELVGFFRAVIASARANPPTLPASTIEIPKQSSLPI